MEDIRNVKKSEKLQRSIKITRFFNKIFKNWYKILIVVIFILILIFPNYLGEITGWWWNDFASSFLEKLTYIK